MNPDAEREKRLPKWAQDKLLKLRRTISELSQEVRIKKGEPTRVFVHDPLRDNHAYIDPHKEIVFIIDGRHQLNVALQFDQDAEDLRGQRLDIRSNGLPIRLHPEASNRITISLEEAHPWRP